MEKQMHISDINILKELCQNKGDITGVIIGHENCPHFYRQMKIDEMIHLALDAGLKVKVNIPVLFEEYLQEFLSEADRLLNTYSSVKLVVNDWGLLYYLHQNHPKRRFVAGKGISFTYGDNPWNEHILLAEKEKYREMLKAHNMENPDTVDELKKLGVDEIEMSDLALSEKAFAHIKEEGFTVSVNRKMSVVTMSRSCHCLRFLNKTQEMGNCIQHCTKNIVISIQQYFDMMETQLKELSPETKAMQPDMHVHGNIIFVNNKESLQEYDCIDVLIVDKRVMGKRDKNAG